MPGTLFGLQILIVEDDPIIALDLVQTLFGAGATILGPAHKVATAMALIDRHRPDLAVLDWRLETETVAPVATRLAGLCVPFLFHTSSRGPPDATYPGAPVIDKPTRPEQLLDAVRRLSGKD